MSIPFFYEPDLEENKDSYSLSESSARHCVQVLRRKVGDTVLLTNGAGKLAKAEIKNIVKRNCEITILDITDIPTLSTKISVAISFTKHTSRIEWFLEKVTEIGITEIFPLQTHRTERNSFNKSRLQNILIAAMLQSEQAWLPILHEGISFEKLVKENNYSGKYIAHCEDKEKSPFEKELKKYPHQNTLILIGPEGDFTPEEITLAKMNHFVPVSLGSNRLRTETAGIVACTLMNAFLQKN